MAIAGPNATNGGLSREASVSAGSDRRLPLVLLVDVSWSIAHRNLMTHLQSVLDRLPGVLRAEAGLRRIVEVAVITFGKEGVRIAATDGSAEPPRSGADAFTPVNELRMPILEADGVTPMFEAIDLALSVCEQRTQALRAAKVLRWVPTILMLTDGEPTDAEGEPTPDCEPVARRLRTAEQGNRALFVAGALEGADRAMLDRIAPGAVHDLRRFDVSHVLRLVCVSSGPQIRAGGAEDFHRRLQDIVNDGALQGL